MRIIAVSVALLASLALGCGGGSDKRAAAPGDAQTKRASDYEDENNVGMSEQRVSRWRWKGARKRCYFIVGNECFTAEGDACKAAGCKGSACEVDDERAPARVTCAKK